MYNTPCIIRYVLYITEDVSQQKNYPLALFANLSVIAWRIEYLSFFPVCAVLWYIFHLSQYNIALIRSAMALYLSFFVSGDNILSIAILLSVMIKIGSSLGVPFIFWRAWYMASNSA